MKTYNAEHQEVIRQILALFPTVDEALQHIVVQLTELRIEDSKVLFKDTADALAAVLTSLLELFPDECDSNVIKSITDMRVAIGQVVDAFEGENVLTIQTALEQQLVPAFQEWRKAVETSIDLFPRGMLGAFCLETIYQPGKGFTIFEVSARIVAGTNLYPEGSPYSVYLFNEPMSTGRRIVREINEATKKNTLKKVVY